MKTEKVFKNYLVCAGLLLFILVTIPILANAAAKKWTVTVSDFAFSPYNLTHVKAGDTICWVWNEGSHTTTSAEIPPGAMAWDSFLNKEMTEFTYVPDVNGTYFYHSTLNPDHPMSGTFVVTGANAVISPFLQVPLAGPNPFSDFVLLRSIGSAAYTRAEVFDLSGKPVVTVIPAETSEAQYYRMPATLPPGIYIFRFIPETGPATTFRLMKCKRDL